MLTTNFVLPIGHIYFKYILKAIHIHFNFKYLYCTNNIFVYQCIISNKIKKIKYQYLYANCI